MIWNALCDALCNALWNALCNALCNAQCNAPCQAMGAAACCFVPPYAYAYATTRMFISQNSADAYQVASVLTSYLLFANYLHQPEQRGRLPGGLLTYYLVVLTIC